MASKFDMWVPLSLRQGDGLYTEGLGGKLESWRGELQLCVKIRQNLSKRLVVVLDFFFEDEYEDDDEDKFLRLQACPLIPVCASIPHRQSKTFATRICGAGEKTMNISWRGILRLTMALI